ncbi:MAG: ATP phosphoribosyltransferase regulatory subunit [Methanolinea sp. SDB]|nr:MAG: ATP phosphoribosyltransferase regulatory subunit [Methanolinea sp. SDB]
MLQKPRGTRDFLPDEMESRRHIESLMRETAGRWGYREICTPEFEELELFTIRSGEGIIQEMYVFEDKGGRKLALRPEITAPVLRMYVNEGHVLPKPIRWFYFADCFRYERPQKGRYRQFWQFGVELIGIDTPIAEAEPVMLGSDILKASGISFVTHVGHLGLMNTMLSGLLPEEKRKIRMCLDKKDLGTLEEYLDSLKKSDLAASLVDLVQCRDITDALEIAGDMPEKEQIIEIFSILDNSGLEYTLNAGIARGLDYYTGLVFECFAENLGAENQVLGGGSYRLAHLFGGKDTPSSGFAIGFDRVMVARGDTSHISKKVVRIVFTPEGRDWALEAASVLRGRGIRTEMDLSSKSLGSQLSMAAKAADYAVIVGERESRARMVMLKNLGSGVQQEMELEEAADEVIRSDPR